MHTYINAPLICERTTTTLPQLAENYESCQKHAPFLFILFFQPFCISPPLPDLLEAKKDNMHLYLHTLEVNHFRVVDHPSTEMRKGSKFYVLPVGSKFLSIKNKFSGAPCCQDRMWIGRLFFCIKK